MLKIPTRNTFGKQRQNVVNFSLVSRITRATIVIHW